MNRIKTLFAKKPYDVLNVYFTAGYPCRSDTGVILQALQEAGVDLVEIGIPYSDPYADGETIQRSHQQALRNGMTLKLLFKQLADCRSRVHIPIVLMGYMNSILQYGVDDFCKKCLEVGVDGVILADLPYTVYERTFKATFDHYGLAYIPLVTPLTPEHLIRRIDQDAKGFIYMVSSIGTTGSVKGITPEMLRYFWRIESMKLRSPRLIGFGIKDQTSFETACEHANGAIIGSAFIRALTDGYCCSPVEVVNRFIRSIRPTESLYQPVSWEGVDAVYEEMV
ncbi:MAG TPA: tryptophan synthase subunit alpha [Fibrella sp.]